MRNRMSSVGLGVGTALALSACIPQSRGGITTTERSTPTVQSGGTISVQESVAVTGTLAAATTFYTFVDEGFSPARSTNFRLLGKVFDYNPTFTSPGTQTGLGASGAGAVGKYSFYGTVTGCTQEGSSTCVVANAVDVKSVTIVTAPTRTEGPLGVTDGSTSLPLPASDPGVPSQLPSSLP